MKKLAMVMACSVLVGCEYTAPLVKTPEIDIDRAAVGLWRRTKDNGQTEDLLVLPWSNRQYLVSFPARSGDAMFARGSLCRVGDRTLAQLDWFGTAEAATPDDDRVFQFVSYSVKGNALTVRLLNSDVISKDIGTTELLAESIKANKDHPKLFREPMIFERVER